MRYFTHRNKAGNVKVCGTNDGPNAPVLVCQIIPAWRLDPDEPAFRQPPRYEDIVPINAKKSGKDQLHWEQGSGIPGRWWQEITEERAKELLGGGAR